MTSTEVSIRRSNKDVARSMLVVGGLLLAVGVVMTFTSNWVGNFWLSGGSAPGWFRDFVMHIWSVGIMLAYPLGSFLVVGSIIVGRLPESSGVESQS